MISQYCPLEEAAKYAEDIAPLTTLRRMVDMTWRLHAGTVQYTINGIKGTVDPEAWVSHTGSFNCNQFTSFKRQLLFLLRML